MVTAKIDRGLCMTCNNASSCFYLQSRGPALFCELFDDYVRPELRTVHEKAPPIPTPSAAHGATDEDTSRYTGLCVNCEHRTTCAHPKPAGGVWHCEDYA